MDAFVSACQELASHTVGNHVMLQMGSDFEVRDTLLSSLAWVMGVCGLEWPYCDQFGYFMRVFYNYTFVIYDYCLLWDHLYDCCINDVIVMYVCWFTQVLFLLLSIQYSMRTLMNGSRTLISSFNTPMRMDASTCSIPHLRPTHKPRTRNN